jgi:hypothetical protein
VRKQKHTQQDQLSGFPKKRTKWKPELMKTSVCAAALAVALVGLACALPALADPMPDPRHFDTRSTTLTECDFSGCPPAYKTSPSPEPAQPAPPPAAPKPIPTPQAETAPDEPTRFQDPRCRDAPYRLYPSLAEVAVAHMLCDPY